MEGTNSNNAKILESVLRQLVQSLGGRIMREAPRRQVFLVHTPMMRFGQLKELAESAIFLSSYAASFVTDTILTAEGGFLASDVSR